MRKIAVVEDCYECPFFINNEYDANKKSRCVKLRLSGSNTDLIKYCPLPDFNEEKKERDC